MDNDRMIDVLARVPDDARAAFEPIGEERSKQPLDGGWTPREILGHLRDSARVYDERVTRVTTEDNPFLLAYDQDEAVAEGNFNEADPSSLLASIAEYRAHTIKVLRSLDEAAWQRPGVHSETGPLTLRSLVEHMVEHETDHVADIRRATS